MSAFEASGGAQRENSEDNHVLVRFSMTEVALVSFFGGTKWCSMAQRML